MFATPGSRGKTITAEKFFFISPVECAIDEFTVTFFSG
jgi:hypothetical protein